MKGLVLAGGKGNGLWPLSREDYPKQFMNLKEDHSLLQETVARNLPFCDEFLIVANAKHHFIVEGQMKAFQGLRYRCFLEESPRGTATAIALSCFCQNPSEFLFVVSADHLMGEGDYKEAILQAKQLAKQDDLVLFGIQPNAPNTAYGYIQHEREHVKAFHEKPEAQTARRYLQEGSYYWNGGIFLFTAGAFLKELSVCSPDLYTACKAISSRLGRSKKNILFPSDAMQSLPFASIERSVLERSQRLKVVPLHLDWCDVDHWETLEPSLLRKGTGNTLQNNCEDLTILNQTEQQLVVANEVNGLVVVNTEDAVYISKKGASPKIKDIMRNHRGAYGRFFEVNPLRYRPWGSYEVLKEHSDYKVKRVTVFPMQSQTLHKHNLRSEHWSVAKGTATITIGSHTQDYACGEGVYVPVGTSHKVENRTREDVVIIEVAIGTVLSEEDMVRLADASPNEGGAAMEILKLEPAFKDYLWGGTRLREFYRKKCDYDVIAESWELSAHEDGQSTIANGENAGMPFGEYLERFGKEALGWKCEAFDRFPVLIKFIDAKEQLSVQVHPDDEFALQHENEFGKNEVWYVIDCEEGATLYYGLKEGASKDELLRRIQDDTILELLNEVPVRKGDVLFVEAGTIHAIGKGIFLCEIQQNSNCTYRLYDYGRKDKYGNARELHLDKALDVAHREPVLTHRPLGETTLREDGNEQERLAVCKYFESVKYRIREEMAFSIDSSSFYSLVVTEGEGTIRSGAQTLEFIAGDSFFVPAGEREVTVTGDCIVIATHV